MKKLLSSFLLLGFISLLSFQACKDDDPVVPEKPKVTSSTSSIDFGSLDLYEESAVESVSITASNLVADVTVTIPDGYKASLTETGTFGTDDITITQAALADGAAVPVYVMTPGSETEANITGVLTISSTDATDATVNLSANVGLVITGTLFTSEYFDTYADYVGLLPLDSGCLYWTLNTDTVTNEANAGAGYPVSTVANNLIKSHWLGAVPLNAGSLRATVGISDGGALSFAGYAATPSGARNIILDPTDGSGDGDWIKATNGACVAGKPNRNTSAIRRFADDGYRGNSETGEVYLSALVNVATLGAHLDGKPDDYGIGDIIFLANNTSGPSNNNNVKVMAIADGAGGFHFALGKQNEAHAVITGTKSYSLATTYAIVLVHKFVEGTNNDVTTLYVFADGDVIPGKLVGLTPEVTIDATTAGYTDAEASGDYDPADLTGIYVRERIQAVTPPTASITGIRVGDTWSATLFSEPSEAVNSNTDVNDRVLTNSFVSCTKCGN
jgi:hypothetical protein